MRLKNTYPYLAVLCFLAFGSSISAQHAALASVPAAKSTTKSRYILMEGDVLGHNRQPVEAFHMDVYEIREDGKRTLARTGHYPSSHYRLHLERGYAYELVVQAIGYETKQFFVEPTVEEVAPVAMTLKSRAVAALPQIASRSAGVQKTTEMELPEWHSLPELAKEDPVAEEGASAEAQDGIPQTEEAFTSTTAHQASLAAESEQQPIEALAHTPRLGKTRKGSPLLRSLQPGDRALLQLPANSTIDILEYTTPDWWMVAYRGEMGWVRAQDVE